MRHYDSGLVLTAVLVLVIIVAMIASIVSSYQQWADCSHGVMVRGVIGYVCVDSGAVDR